MLAVDQEGLAPEHGDEADAVLAQPDHGRARVVDEPPRHVLVGLVAGDLHQRVVEHLAVVHRQDDLLALRLGQVGEHVRRGVVDAGVAEAEAARR